MRNYPLAMLLLLTILALSAFADVASSTEAVAAESAGEVTGEAEKAATATKAAKAAAPKKEKKKKRKMLYTDIVEVAENYAKRECLKVGRERKQWRKNKRYTDRCELFVERVEALCTEVGYNWMNAMNITDMAEVLESAFITTNMYKLKGFLNEVAVFAFDQPKVTEKEIDSKLHTQFTKWFVDVITRQHEPGGNMAGVDKIARRMRYALRKRGTKVPGEGDYEEDLENEDDIFDDEDDLFDDEL